MRLMATKLGFYRGYRIKPGDVFEFDMRGAKCELKRDESGAPLKSGKRDQWGAEIFLRDPTKPMLPTWAVEATPENRAEFIESQRNEQERSREAALVSAGPRRGRKKGYATAPGAEYSVEGYGPDPDALGKRDDDLV